MNWASLISIKNLRLAWRRINTGQNIQYKRFFRDFYLVYEPALEENLRYLKQQLKAHNWKPSHPLRIYIPKPSGLQRPISLLGIEDQILLQAIANIFAKKLAKKRKSVELKNVFSNILSKSTDSIFFFQPWKQTYYDFQVKCTEYFSQGSKWIGHFDLAAYYDTISHEILIRIISPKNQHHKTWEEVKDWFAVWSSSKKTAKTSHGIPQGPNASDFLAEAFFLPIDIALRKRGIKYIRYVDDIRLFGATENEAINASITLEWLCRDHGLIPQGKKFTISYANTLDDALGSLPSIPPKDEGEERQQMKSKEAISLLQSCVKGRPLRVVDKSRFRYVMFRAPKSFRILDKVMSLLPRHPEHIDSIMAYFNNYAKSKKIPEEITNILLNGIPYSYVRGELWHLLTRLGTKDQLRKALEMARADVRERKKCLVLSWGVMNFLIRCQNEGLCRIGKRLKSELPMSRALLGSRIPQFEFEPRRLVVSMLKGTLEEQLAAARQLQIRNCSLSKLNLRQRNLPQVCQNSLKALGVIKRIRQSPRDWIAERLQKQLGGNLTKGWRSLLGSEYEHALQILIVSDAMFDLDPSNWLQNQDSFNDIVIRQFINYLHQRNLSGGNQRIVAKNERLVKYGSLLDSNGRFAAAFPKISKSLIKVHERRNTIPGSHPYNEKGGTRNRWLTRRERDSLLNEIKCALNEVANYVSNNP